MRIGIFGGSFDPVHSEHIALCVSAVESLKLDRLFVMPAHIPPHKRGKTLLPDEERKKMCEIAFKNVKNTVVSDYEINSEGTSYSYLTCEHFRNEYKDAEIYFLVGTDMLRDFPTWKEPKSILKNVKLGVCARAEEEGWTEKELEKFRELFNTDFTVIPYNGKKVSSTRIRILSSAGEDISSYVGEEIAKYIKEKGFYKVQNAKEALALEKETRKNHSIRVAFYSVEHAKKFGVDENKALISALFHDCGKNVDLGSPLLSGFVPPENVPEPVMHQYIGAYLAENAFGIKDEDVLNAIRYHTSGRKNMSALEKLTFVADMVEEGRNYPEVDDIRKVLEEKGLNEGFLYAIEKSLEFLNKKGGEIYSLTQEAYLYALENK